MATKKKVTRRTTSSRAPVAESVQEPSFANSKPAANPVRSKKFIIPVVLLVVLGLLYLFKGVFVSATVNGQPISRLAVVKELEKTGGKRTLDNLITKELILQEGKKKNISITQKDLDGQLKTIEGNLKQQGMTIDQALQAQGMSRKALNDELRVQLTVQKLVGSNIVVSDKEVQDYIEQNKEFLQSTNPDQEPDANQIREQLKQQKLQEKTQKYIEDLRKNAKISYFTAY